MPSRRAATTLTGSSAISTGTCSTRSSCSATSTPTCTRPTCSCWPATRSATSTSGSSASCPDRVRDSLTRYSWLLFRGEVEGAVLELMRWLAPGPATDTTTARWQLIRVHQAFLYDTVVDRPRTTAGAPGPGPHGENPYSKLAVDILETIRDAAADDVVEHRRLLQDAGHPRDASSRAGGRLDLPAMVRRFVRGLARQQGMAWLDPRRTWTGCTPATGRVQRALEFVEFVEAQEPFIGEATARCSASAAGSATRAAARVARRVGARASGRVLYFVLAYPDDTRTDSCRAG